MCSCVCRVKGAKGIPKDSQKNQKAVFREPLAAHLVSQFWVNFWVNLEQCLVSKKQYFRYRSEIHSRMPNILNIALYKTKTVCVLSSCRWNNRFLNTPIIDILCTYVCVFVCVSIKKSNGISKRFFKKSKSLSFFDFFRQKCEHNIYPKNAVILTRNMLVSSYFLIQIGVSQVEC